MKGLTRLINLPNNKMELVFCMTQDNNLSGRESVWDNKPYHVKLTSSILIIQF